MVELGALHPNTLVCYISVCVYHDDKNNATQAHSAKFTLIPNVYINGIVIKQSWPCRQVVARFVDM